MQNCLANAKWIFWQIWWFSFIFTTKCETRLFNHYSNVVFACLFICFCKKWYVKSILRPQTLQIWFLLWYFIPFCLHKLFHHSWRYPLNEKSSHNNVKNCLMFCFWVFNNQTLWSPCLLLLFFVRSLTYIQCLFIYYWLLKVSSYSSLVK